MSTLSDLTTLTLPQLESILQPITIPTTSPLRTFSNWAKTFHCTPTIVYLPTTTLQCRTIVEYARRMGYKVRAVGVGHSPSDLGCTGEVMVRMTEMKGVIDINPATNLATLQPGINLTDLHVHLSNFGLAMRNVGSISDSTLGGIISTGTHGSGHAHPILSSHVHSLTLISSQPGAPLITCSRTTNADLFHATLCGLGLTGLIVEVVYEVEREFRLRQVSEKWAVDELLGGSGSEGWARALAQTSEKTPLLRTQVNGDASSNGNGVIGSNKKEDDVISVISKSSQHSRLWWYPQSSGVVVALADRTYEDVPPTGTSNILIRTLVWFFALFGLAFNTDELIGYHFTHFLLFLSWIGLIPTRWVGAYAWWLIGKREVRVDVGWKVFCFDCLFPQYTTEWAIDASQTTACVAALKAWLDAEAADPKGQRPHFPIEIRFAAADDIWLSPAYGRQTAYVGIVQYRPYGLDIEYKAIFDRFTGILAEHGGRPHWAKEHEFGPDKLAELYPKFGDFCDLVKKVDPEGRWRNEYTSRHFGRALE